MIYIVQFYENFINLQQIKIDRRVYGVFITETL